MKDIFSKVFNWVKNNKLLAVLLVVVIYLLIPRRSVFPQLLNSKSAISTGGLAVDMAYPSSSESMMGNYGVGRGVPAYEAAPRPDVTDRKVITNSSMSLQVKNVREAMESIKQKTKSLGGYVVDTDVTTPEFGEDGSIAVRVPLDSLDDTLAYFRSLAIKVVSENISGYDITDQYIDIEERLTRLEATKARFEQILDSAVTVDEILEVQRQIFYVQDQIDSYKGQLQYMEGASSTTLIRVYLSTDELGLPYTPSQAWRPEVVFKQASRSLLLNLISIGNAAIWFVVYIPLILVGVLVLILIKKVVIKKKPSSQ